MVRGAVLAVALIALAPGAMAQAPAQAQAQAQAQAPSAASIMGRLYVLGHYVVSCHIEVTRAQNAALSTAGENLQARLKLTDAEVKEGVRSASANLPAVDCTAFKASLQQQVDSITSAAAALP